MWLAIRSLWHREVVRFLSDRSRVTSSLGQPVVFWVLFAGALGNSFRPGGVGYGEYFFPGTLAMIVLFTSIFSTITVIEDRKEGFLQGVLVSPVHPVAIAAGKILGAATLALLHGLVFALLAPVAGIPLEPLQMLAAFGVLALMAIAVGGMGFSLAWAMDSTTGYHGIMMLGFMPMLLLSGAFFPSDGAHPVMSVLMALDPLTYGVAALRYAFYGTGHSVTQELPGPLLSLAVTVAFGAATMALGTLLVLRRTARNVV